jgi:hypothetical protein
VAEYALYAELKARRGKEAEVERTRGCSIFVALRRPWSMLPCIASERAWCHPAPLDHGPTHPLIW